MEGSYDSSGATQSRCEWLEQRCGRKLAVALHIWVAQLNISPRTADEITGKHSISPVVWPTTTTSNYPAS